MLALTSLRGVCNMKTAFALIALVATLFSYMILSTRFGLSQRFPIIHYLLGLAILLYMTRQVVAKYNHFKLFTNILGWCVYGAFLWYTLSYSSYDTQPEIEVGSNPGIHEVVLRDSSGNPFDLEKELANRDMTLLIFYRGYW